MEGAVQPTYCRSCGISLTTHNALHSSGTAFCFDWNANDSDEFFFSPSPYFKGISIMHITFCGHSVTRASPSAIAHMVMELYDNIRACGKSMATWVAPAGLRISGLELQWEITYHEMICLELCRIHASVLPGTGQSPACTRRGEGNGHSRCQEPQIFGLQYNDWVDGCFTYFSKVIWIVCSQNVTTNYFFHMVENHSWPCCVKESLSILPQRSDKVEYLMPFLKIGSINLTRHMT